jgi:energy-coupling factor transporter ATP-binding protein EcfA2
MRVRVRNFQSIKDAEVEIRGFVVITGPNNSGKTSFMRAIRGLFTNAPAGPLLRTGESFLSVEVTFDDGVTVLWEKGWENPHGKGKTINRYVLNGVELSNVGRGVPPEVEALGVCAISAGSDRTWPQIAQQFDGALFLVNRPGSVVAEALSDVSRVGQLTSALRLSEKDRRSASSELKIRRQDVTTYKTGVLFYDGLDPVLDTHRELVQRAKNLSGRAKDLQDIKGLGMRLQASRSVLDALKGFDASVLPAAERSSSMRGRSRDLSGRVALDLRLKPARQESKTFLDFGVSVPDPSRAIKIEKALKTCRSFSKRRGDLKDSLAVFEGAPLGGTLPDEASSRDILLRLKEAKALGALLGRAAKDLAASDEALTYAQEKSLESQSLVRDLLGERGVCPTCGTVCGMPPHS